MFRKNYVLIEISYRISVISSSSIIDMTRTEAPDKDYAYPYCCDVSKYEIIFKIGQGTFGEVFKARETNVRTVFYIAQYIPSSSA